MRVVVVVILIHEGILVIGICLAKSKAIIRSLGESGGTILIEPELIGLLSPPGL